MAANPFKISTLTLCAALAAIVALELLLGRTFQWLPIARYAKVGLLRLIQIATILWIVYRLEGGLQGMGWSAQIFRSGLKKGAYWSLGFAAAAALGMGLIYLSGYNPLRLIRSPLPSQLSEMIALFVVGALIAPIAEEICFRGIIYAYFRRWGVVVALLASTAIFVFMHFYRIPVTQAVGGLVFALAFETSRNLVTPITIHALGNLALFTLSLPIFQR